MPLWHLRRSDAVVELTYDNPPRNFLTFRALEELGAHLADLADDPTAAVIVLRSADPQRFIAHADLDELARLADGPVPEARAWYTTMRLIETMPQPVVAAIDGQAWGGGLELSLACTLRWASPRAHFAAIETALGIIPGAGGSQRLIRLIGRGPATDLVLSGMRVDAERAAQLGLVSRVLTGDFRAEVSAAAAELASLPRAAVAAAKRVVREGSELALGAALRLEGETFASLLATPESLRLQAAARARYAAADAADDVDVANLGAPA
ncbi:enoyl-CoA hydratase/isomerase family protein [Pimelobacter simplex]|uniref:Enoyl-CoA hydratase/isomerase family protein n=1 Tax=Nocardioides simplex TaxID=2045 RepID=A0A7J5DYD3_NOCSI|nr:enoyl-CoA hydratase/isomerase family protein [Pimelobacter simplex]KAB2810903.1 enoyl-CoA hydratase/isomerase family protein [Pimelobacter simplex]